MPVDRLTIARCVQVGFTAREWAELAEVAKASGQTPEDWIHDVISVECSIVFRELAKRIAAAPGRGGVGGA